MAPGHREQRGGSSESSDLVNDVHDGITVRSEFGDEVSLQQLSGAAGTVAFLAAILALGFSIGLTIPDVYSPLPHWAAKVSNVVGMIMKGLMV